MGLMSSSMHVANASCKTIRARVAQEETRIQEIDASLGITGAPISLDASIKAKLDHNLDVTGFARIGPQEALEFALPKGFRHPIYVSVTTADDPSPLVICFNYTPPRNKSVLITNNGTVVLSVKKPANKISIHPPVPSDSFKVHLRNGGMNGSVTNNGVVQNGFNNYGVDRRDGCDWDDDIMNDDDDDDDDMTWMTADGLCYTFDMARRVYLQSDVDVQAAKLFVTSQ